MMIEKYCRNRNISNILFDIVINCMGAKRVRHFITFITYNSNIEDFKLLDLSSHSMVGRDSFDSAVKSNIDFIDTLIENIKIKGIEYINHVLYLTNIKESWERRYEYELKRGHKNRLYDL